MDRRIKELYNESILMEATARYGVEPVKVRKLGGFESFIYEYSKNGKDHILRITHSFHRSMDDLTAEMEWVRYLTENGGDVAGAVYSENGLLAEKISSGDSYFIASSIEKAPGKPPARDVWDSTLFREWGRAVGKLHRLTKSYIPVNKPRFQWYEEYLIRDFNKYIPTEREKIIKKTGETITRIKSFKTDRDSYGLIHTDVHQGNFFHDNGKITIFDFDDCAYKHFVSDIAIAVFYSMMSKNDFSSKEDFAEYFLHHFMEGYSLENTIGGEWMKRLPDFLKLREVVLYTAICRSMSPDEPDEWCANYLNKHRPTIENDVPVLARDIV